MNEPKIELTITIEEVKILLYALATSQVADRTFGTWRVNELLNSLSDKLDSVMEIVNDGKQTD